MRFAGVVRRVACRGRDGVRDRLWSAPLAEASRGAGRGNRGERGSPASPVGSCRRSWNRPGASSKPVITRRRKRSFASSPRARLTFNRRPNSARRCSFGSAGDFAQAATALQHFIELKPPPRLAWLNDFKPLAQDRLDDYQLFLEWQKTRDASKDPEVALMRLRDISGKLKAKGALAFQFADEEAKISSRVAEVAEKNARRKRSRRAAEEAPRWQAALVAEWKSLAAYQFENALSGLDKLKLTAASLQAERDVEMQPRELAGGLENETDQRH